MALGVVDLQSYLGVPLLQCKEGSAHRLWFALQQDIICVGCTRSVCVVSGQVFEGRLQHQRDNRGPSGSPCRTLAQQITGVSSEFAPAIQSLLKSPYRYHAYRAIAGDAHVARTCFIITSCENVMKALFRSTWRVTVLSPLSHPRALHGPALGCRR